MTYAEILMRKGKRGAAAYVQVISISNFVLELYLIKKCGIYVTSIIVIQIFEINRLNATPQTLESHLERSPNT